MKKFKAPFTGEVWNRVCYLIYPDKWYSLQEISKKWGDPPFIAEKYIRMAMNSKVIIAKGIGRVKKYKLNREDDKVKDMLKKFEEMRAEYLSSRSPEKLNN